MEFVLRALRALGILVVIWGILLLAGWLADVAPPPGTDAGAEHEATALPEGEGESASSAESSPGADATASAASEDETEPTADALEPEAEVAEAPQPLPRYLPCDGTSGEPTLRLVDLFDGAVGQLVVGCGAETHLLAVMRDAEGTRPAPVRIARIRYSPERPETRPRLADAVSHDMTGDGRPDLLLALVQVLESGAPSGGSLQLIPGNAMGAFDPPIQLASIAAVSLAFGSVDAEQGADLVAMNRTDSFGRRASEAWVFAGGAAPARRARLRAGQRGLDAAIADLDRDGHPDVITLSDDSPAVHIHFGDGRGGFPRSRTLPEVRGRELVVADLDADGGDDVLIAGEGLFWIRAGRAESLVAHPIAAPADLTSLQVLDADGDNDGDVVAISGDGVIAIRQGPHQSFESGPLFDLPIAIGTPRRLLVAELDGAPGLDAALLIRATGEEARWELILVPDAGGDPSPHVAEVPVPIADAPLQLSVSLR